MKAVSNLAKTLVAVELLKAEAFHENNQAFARETGGIAFGAPTDTGARGGDRSRGFERKSLNALTPETETTIHYFWADAHNFDVDKPEVTQLLFEQVHEAFMEDKAFLEAQQSAFDRDRGRPLVDINADAGGLEARRILDRLLEAQDRRPARRADAV